MVQTMKDILNRMLNHEELSREEMKNILIGITHSEYPTEQITALLTALQMRGVTVDELLGFRDGILETGVPAILNADRYIDVVGTGGDRKNTFNISTTSCFVIAGAGYKVAKHGNYAATSVSGASNVIAHHGIKFTDDIDKLNRSLNEAGIVYLHAQLFAKAMKFVGPIRKALQFPRRLASTTVSSTLSTATTRYHSPAISKSLPDSTSASSSPVTSASRLPSPKNWWAVLLKKRLQPSSMQYSRTVPCLLRRISCWPTPPSASRYWRKARRASRSVLPLPVSLSTAAVPCVSSRSSSS